MKKFISLMLALLMMLSLCACAEKEQTAEEPAGESATEETAGGDTQEAVGVANPMSSFNTLEELNEAVGGRLCHPDVEGISDESYYKIEGGNILVGEYNFTVDGMEYCLRFSPYFDHDISGIYVGDGTAFSDEMPDDIEYAATEDIKLARWVNIDGQYCLAVTDNGEMDDGRFADIAEELCDLTMPNGMGETVLEDYYASLAGNYQDTVSQRATAEVTAEENGVNIKVYWGNSYDEMYMWEMNALKSEDGLLYYDDCTHSIIGLDDDGAEATEVVYENGEGYFSESDGVLYWDGAADEACRACTFEKL